ncbi:hypothetical protein [Actinoplanes sp. M2I2]|uniref:hypothetical protein n=1 Tax=Actinoplanes sp. M2I2 TaxID=1734444 RepID=UPI0020212004|nr:hypothetical protein [Actinoplanes sp. M2I2]
MTSRDERTSTAGRSRSGADLRVARATAESLQAIIRLADAKAATLLGVAGGMVTMSADMALATQPCPVPAALVFALTALTSAKAGWHLLAVVRPRIDGWPARAGAWDQELAALRRIAVAKNREALRSIPWLVLSGGATGAEIALAIANNLWIS